MDDEDRNLAATVFLRVVRTKHPALWAKTEEEPLFVCVPQSGSFAQPAEITLAVAESHFMRESKLFLGTYETLNGRTVTVEGNRLITKEGWDESRECRILFEELFYNSAWQKFRVVCIDRPLVGGRALGEHSTVPVLPPLAQRTLDNSKAYLEAFPENELVLRKIRTYVQQFVATYYIVKGFEHHAQDKVRGLLNKSTEDLLCTNTTFRAFHYEDRNMEALSQVVANYMFEGLHPKLFGSMCEIHADDDSNVLEICSASRESVSLAEIGSGKAFAATDLPRAIASLQSLEARVTPLEKLLCLKETIDGINADVVTYRTSSAQGGDVLVTADELLPLLVFAIVRAAPPHLSASLAYAEHFTLFNVQTSELGYCLGTFKAALALLTESRLLLRRRRDVFPDSRFVERKGRGSLTSRRPTPAPPVDSLKRTISVPSALVVDNDAWNMHIDAARKPRK